MGFTPARWQLASTEYAIESGILNHVSGFGVGLLSNIPLYAGIPGSPTVGGIVKALGGAGCTSSEGELAGGLAGMVALGAAGGGGGGAQGYKIVDGVRRAKAAEMLGKEAIEALVQKGDKIVGKVHLDPASLASPKAAIDVSNPTNMQRWTSVLQGTGNGDALPPIIVQLGNSGTPIPFVGFLY